MLTVFEGSNWADGRPGRLELTESHALESVERPSGNQALVVAGWRWSGPAAALTLDQ